MLYRDLPAVHLTPRGYARLVMPDTAKISGISISPGGEVIWSAYLSRRSSLIFAEDSTPISLYPSDTTAFGSPLVQRFPDGRWLVVESRTDPDSSNAFVFDTDRKLLRSFYLGDGIQTVLLDRSGRIWVGYFDEGIFGAFNPMPPAGHASYRYGPSGLLRCNDRGGIEFSYNTEHPTQSIADIYALTLDDADTAWFCPYTDFFLASVSQSRVDYVLPKAPVTMADAISVGRDYYAFFGGYKKSSMIALVHRESQRLRLIQLRKESGDTLSPVRVATRGSRAVAVADNCLFRLDQEVLLGALGPWSDANTSTVSSAVQYIEEERAYSDYYVIYPGRDAKKVPGESRPPEKQPRKDEDTDR